MPISSSNMQLNQSTNTIDSNIKSKSILPNAKYNGNTNNTTQQNQNQNQQQQIFKFSPFNYSILKQPQFKYPTFNLDSSLPISQNYETNYRLNRNNFDLFDDKSTILKQQQKQQTLLPSNNITNCYSRLRSENLNLSSSTDKILKRLINRNSSKESGKILKRSNIEKSKKISNYGIIQSFNLVEKEKYRRLLEQNMGNTFSKPPLILNDENIYKNLVKSAPTEINDDNLIYTTKSNEKLSLPVSNLVSTKKVTSAYSRRISNSKLSSNQQSSIKLLNENSNVSSPSSPSVIVINEKKSSVLKSNNVNQIPPQTAKIEPTVEKPIKILQNSSNNQNDTKISNLPANRVIAQPRKIIRQLSDYEKRFNERTQHTNEIIDSILEKCKESRRSSNTIIEEDKFMLSKRQRLEDEAKLAKQFSERLHLNTNNLSKYYYEEQIYELNEFLELSSEQELSISKSLIQYPLDEVLTSGFNINITRKDIQTLKGLNWLNDEIINFYMNLICERSLKSEDTRIYAFTTFFYPKLIKDGFNSLKRWTRKINLFSFNLLLVPVHLGLHWTLAVVDMNCKEIRYYDSMNGYNVECLKALRNYLRDEHLDKKSEQLDLTQWSYIHVQDIPQQMNGSDCGIFACKYAEFISRGKTNFCFNQTHMPYYRRRMIWEILNKKLL